MRTIELGFTVGAYNKHTFIAEVPQQVTKQPERAPIRPVQIIGIEDQRLAASDRSEHLRDGVEKQKPLFVWRQLMEFRKRTETRFDFGGEFCDLGRRVAERPTQFTVVFFFADPTAKGFHKWQVRSSGFIFVTTTSENDCAIDGGLNRNLPCKSSFARAWFSA